MTKDPRWEADCDYSPDDERRGMIALLLAEGEPRRQAKREGLRFPPNPPDELADQ